MLFALAVILLVIALVGGIAVSKFLFILLLFALLAFLVGVRA